MSAVEKVGSKIAEVLEANGPGLKDTVVKILGKSVKPVRVASGVVSKVGLSFFENKKPQNVWASHVTPASDLAAGLMQRSIYQFSPAYMAEIELEGKKYEAYLSLYHTKQHHGETPELREGDVVDVYVAPNRGSITFTYTPAKLVK